MKTKLYETLNKLGISNPADWQDYIGILLGKLEFLNDLGRYDGLLKNIFSSNDRNNFNSFAFEAAFAYDFEFNGHQLTYEVNILPDSPTSIDYCYETEGGNIYFELKIINQGAVLADSIENQLKHNGSYEIIQGGEEEHSETIRLQNLILSKCQDEGGNPVKFGHEEGSYNFIVVFVSALHLGMIDKADCLLAMHGDEGVPLLFRRGVFGLCQQLSEHATEEERSYYERSNHFRETIHGVLFVKNASREGDPKYLVDLKLQYVLVGNYTILEKRECDAITEKLFPFLLTWSDNKKPCSTIADRVRTWLTRAKTWLTNWSFPH